MTPYEVQQGDCMISIGAANGLPWRYIWERPENAGLRATRTPEILYPGDIVNIPEFEAREETRPTGASYRFKLTGGWTRMRIRFLFLDEPQRNVPARVEVGGRVAQLSTDGDGVLECRIPGDAPTARVTLLLEDAPEVYDFDLGALDPIDTISGIQQRLKSLGYDPGPIDNVNGPKTQRGVRAFQYDQKLQVDGIAGPITKGRLTGVYGC